MKKFSALPFVIALALIICTLGSRTESADNPLRELQGRKDQLKAWETYRDEAQKELDRKSAELESARAAADVGAREKEIEKREQAIDKDAPKALKEAFKSDVTGKMSFAALWGTIKIALNTFKLSSAINESIAIQADIDGVQTKETNLTKDVAELQSSVQISDAVIAALSQRIATLKASGMTTFYSLPAWMQQALNSAAQAQQRQQARLDAEAKAEAARQQASRDAQRSHEHGDHPTHEPMQHDAPQREAPQHDHPQHDHPQHDHPQRDTPQKEGPSIRPT